jgi:hypothetical protein
LRRCWKRRCELAVVRVKARRRDLPMERIQKAKEGSGSSRDYEDGSLSGEKR